MFTGIIAAVGRIRRVDPIGGGSGLRLRVDAGALDLSDVRIGDSIAIQGACMTVVELADGGFDVDVSRESLDLTVGLDAPADVNLEKAMTLAERLGGHLVSGHVDGLGEVVRFEPVGESHLLEIRVPGELARFFAYKGSVTVDGVSLTVNRVRDEPEGTVIAINLIPHTVQVTTLGRLAPGARVNLEVDQIARYVDRILQARR
ncbi:MAG: riboflavin synthase [Burkholderiaceae bacterium]